ncbi:predicted protein [Thalassiosira pseudonana CCMP1335]|uniref:Sulfotransferase domain-containing protein n=1 Tax=Thalassiosira pseudonana TaxID=35128 RepID=B8CBM2_THAPS|nr:predicted protein [Thalassiosira pseudonana CCMP1335]EED89341.1 predicted protein [Thalassiosira pseudonana CCMP1335]
MARVPRSGSSAAPKQHNDGLYRLTGTFVALAILDLVLLWIYMHVTIAEPVRQNSSGAEASLLHLSDWRDVEKKTKALRDWKKIASEKKSLVKETSYYNVDDRIAKILESAMTQIDEETAAKLPKWQDIVSMYGEKPIIHGLETCEPYRETVPPENRMTGPAGLFNTGTNLLFQLMKENCDIKEAKHSTSHHEPRENGIRYQPPWGKHNPPKTHRFKNVAQAWGGGIKQDDFLPIVLIKDPYSWMGSECRHKYFANWDHTTVKYAIGEGEYTSLLDVWNVWYNEYEELSFPMLQTRFEDLLFHGEEVLKIACECVGGVFTDDFVYIERNAKEDLPIHTGANGLVESLVQYGDPSKRLTGFTDRDRYYASKNLDSQLMEKFGYNPPPLPTS